MRKKVVKKYCVCGKLAKIGSNFDDFLKQEGMLGQTTAVVTKRVMAYQKKHLAKKTEIRYRSA